MASNAEPFNLYDEIWRSDNHYLRTAYYSGRLERWTVSSLCEHEIESKIAEYKRLLEEQRVSFQNHCAAGGLHGKSNVATLSSLSIARIINLLEETAHIAADVRTVAKYLNSSSIKAIVRDCRTPYPALRAFMGLPAAYGPAEAAETARGAVDIDEAILVNERYIRAKSSAGHHDHSLIRLEDANLIFDASHLETRGEQLVITRKGPPKGGLELFDVHRPRQLAIHRTDQAFITTFNRITRNALAGLNWDNVFVAGGMVLTTLLHTDPAKDDEKRVQDSDIDLYLYGLTPQAANQKVREIYQVWSGNLPSESRQRLVVKNAKTITFLADYPNRRLQIVLKLVPSPLSVLLNFDLDPCAMGFNGRHVLMLPRAARALETGYTTFTMDLVWGHHLQDRRATQDLRVFKYADRGFGVRILPSYARCLEPVDLSRHVYEEYQPFSTCSRKPTGPEMGLKTLRRSAFVASCMLYSFYYPSFRNVFSPFEGNWHEAWHSALQAMDRKWQENVDLLGEPTGGPYISLSDFDTNKLHGNFPGRRKGIGNFEVWMRHHEAWRMDAIGRARLDRNSMTAMEYDGQEYDDLPDYPWNETFNVDVLSNNIVRHNDALFGYLREAICDRLDPPLDPRTGGWRDYLTRRIRRVVHGNDIDSIFEKQITIPLAIPYDLEEYIERLAREALSDAGVDISESQNTLLIPVHVAGQGTHVLPDLQDTARPVGNIRYWVLGNEIMWAGIDRRIDEIFEVLWALFGRFNSSPGAGHRLDFPEAQYHLARQFYKRLPGTIKVPKPVTPMLMTILDPFQRDLPSVRASEAEQVSAFDGHCEAIPRREAVIFQEWALRPAPSMSRHDWADHDMVDDLMAERYPPPDDLFWKDGDEGEFKPGDVSQWT